MFQWLNVTGVSTTRLPSEKAKLLTEVQPYRDHKDNLCIIENELLMKEREIISQALPQVLLKILCLTHQGITSMNEEQKP